MPTVDNRFVNRASTAGGDGTTNATSGANRAWATMEEARAGILAAYASLVASDVRVYCECTGTVATVDTTALGATWPTQDATRYIEFAVPVASRVVPWDANVYTYGRAVNFASALIITNGWVRLTGIQVYHAGNLNVGGNNGIFYNTTSGTPVLDGVKVAKSQNAGGAAILFISLGGTAVVRNCSTGHNAFGASSFGWTYGVQAATMPSNSAVLVYNLTSVNNNNGADARAVSIAFNGGATNAVARLKNILDQLSTNDLRVTNATTDDRATNVHSTTTTATFVDASTGNLRLTVADAVARNLGTDLSGVADWPFSIDGDQTTRPVGSAWDIGAHEQTTPNTGGFAFATII